MHRVPVADGRFVSRSIGQNEQLARVSLDAALLFTWCVPHVDVEGRMTGNPELIKATVCPLRPEITVGRIPGLLRQLVREGLVLWYETGGRQYLALPGFSRQQKGLRKDREAPSRIPSPQGKGAMLVGGADPSQLTLVDNGRVIHRGVGPEDSGSPPGEVEVEVEVEGEVEVAAADRGVAPESLDYATRCTIAANQGLEQLLAGAYRPLVATVEQPTAAAWEAAGIPLPLAQQIIAERIAGFRATAHNRQPHTLRYFDAAVREAHARAMAHGAPRLVKTDAEIAGDLARQELARAEGRP